MEHGQDWVKRQTALIGERVAFYRQRVKDRHGRGLTAQGLAERCSGLGLKMERPAIAKLENGLRQGITVAEVQVLALALGVAPADLLFPVGYVQAVEAHPGCKSDPWTVRQWFAGQSVLPGRHVSPPGDTPGVLWSQHQHYVHRLATEQDRAQTFLAAAARDAAAAGDESAAAQAVETAQAIADVAGQWAERTSADLRRVRAEMRAIGMTPPELDPATAREIGEEE